MESLTVDDLIKEAIQKNDVHRLLSSIRQRWLKHSVLVAEIEPLSHRLIDVSFFVYMHLCLLVGCSVKCNVKTVSTKYVRV